MGTSFDIIFYISFAIYLVGFLFQTLRLLKYDRDKYSKIVLRYSVLAFIFTTIGTLGESLFLVISIVSKEEIKAGLIVSYIFLLLNSFSVIINFVVDRKRIIENVDVSSEDGVIYVDGVLREDEVKKNNTYITNSNNKD